MDQYTLHEILLISLHSLQDHDYRIVCASYLYSKTQSYKWHTPHPLERESNMKEIELLPVHYSVTNAVVHTEIMDEALIVQ